LTLTPLKFGICESNFQPSGWNFWPNGPQVESKIRAHWAQSEKISFGCLVLSLPDAYQLERKISQENPKKQASSMPTT
jgi:hypothetical protein